MLAGMREHSYKTSAGKDWQIAWHFCNSRAREAWGRRSMGDTKVVSCMGPQFVHACADRFIQYKPKVAVHCFTTRTCIPCDSCLHELLSHLQSLDGCRAG